MPVDHDLSAPTSTLLEVAHVAHRLGFGQEFVRELLRTHKLRGVRFGRRWRVDPRDLEVFIDRRKTQLDPPAPRPRGAALEPDTVSP